MKMKIAVVVLSLVMLTSGLMTITFAREEPNSNVPDGDLPAYFYEWPENPQLNATEVNIDANQTNVKEERRDIDVLPQHMVVEAGGPYQNMSGRTIHFFGWVQPPAAFYHSPYPYYLVSYRWDFGDGRSYIGHFPIPVKDVNGRIAIADAYPCRADHTYQRDGYYTAKLTVYSNRGDHASDYALVAINRPIPNIDFPVWPPSWINYKSSAIFSKNVKDPDTLQWVKTADFYMGEEIHFKIRFNIPSDIENPRNIVIRDYLPSTVRYVSARPSPSLSKVVYFDRNSLTFHPFTVLTWKIGSRSPGTSISVEIVGKVDRLNHSYFGISREYRFIPISYTRENTAVCTYKYTVRGRYCGNPYTRTSNLKSIATFDIKSGEPSINIIKKVSKSPYTRWYKDVTVNAGETVGFNLIISNDGNFQIPQPIYVRDLLPSGFEYVSGSASYKIFHGNSITPPMPKEPVINNNRLLWIFNNSIDVNSGIILTFRALAKRPGIFNNIGTVTAHYDYMPLYDSDNATIHVERSPTPIINVEKKVWDGERWAKSASVVLNKPVKFKITVSNNGEVNLTHIVINDTLPPILTGRHIEWNIPRLDIGQSDTIIFNATADRVGGDYNRVRVTCDQGVSDEDKAYVDVSCLNLDIGKYVSVDNHTWSKNIDVYTGDKIYYMIHVKNNGTADLHNISITDSVMWLTFLSFAASYPEPDYINNSYIYWNISLLKPGEDYYIYYSADALYPGNGCNLVYGKSDDGVEDSDCSHVVVMLKPITDVEVYKYVSLDGQNWSKSVTAHIGDTIKFKIVVKNNGTTYLDTIYLNDTIPEFLEFVNNSFIPAYPSIDGKNVSWILNDLPPSEYAEIYFNATSIEYGNGDNVVKVDAVNGTTHAHASDSAHISIVELPNMTLEKYVKWDCTPPYYKELDITPDQWADHRWVTFKIYVNNTGDTPLDVSVRDDIPDGMAYRENSSYVNYIRYDPEIVGNTLYWNFTNIQPDEGKIITFVVDILSCGNYTNVVHATGEYNCERVDRESFAIVRTPPCTCTPSIYVDKKVWNNETKEWLDSISVYSNPVSLRYNITVRNIGTCTLRNLTIIDFIGCLNLNPRDFYESRQMYRDWNTKMRKITWKLNDSFEPGSVIYIEYTATTFFGSSGHSYNRVNTSAEYNNSLIYANEDVVNIYLTKYHPNISILPESIDLGNILRGNRANTQFDIWNSGDGILIFNATENYPEVSISPENGTSSGVSDKKTIIVQINTTSLSLGDHTYYIQISSNGGEKTVTVRLTVVEPPSLSIYPDHYNFGDIQKGDAASTTFYISNDGGSILRYSVMWNCDWIDVSPTNGTISPGNRTRVRVSVDTSSLPLGNHRCNLTVYSNGGRKTFTISISTYELLPPNVKIEKPLNGTIYLWNKELFKFFRTIIIGPISVMANASDPDGSIEKVEFYINNESKFNDTEAPYEWALNERLIGRYMIKVVAYDDQGLSSEDQVDALIISLGIRSVNVE